MLANKIPVVFTDISKRHNKNNNRRKLLKLSKNIENDKLLLLDLFTPPYLEGTCLL